MPIKWSISNSDTKAVITMKFEDYSPEIQAKLMEIGNAAADAVESQESPAEGIPEDSPNFSPELELSRLINRRKAELEYIDARIAQMVLRCSPACVKPALMRTRSTRATLILPN